MEQRLLDLLDRIERRQTEQIAEITRRMAASEQQNAALSRRLSELEEANARLTLALQSLNSTFTRLLGPSG